ncbi:hypothetical protein [Haloprofundus salinisoli]|uniref:hypothetical protein n=1 Tax=Haloprofundus salinisoli TaxID=2876193 RepID=UPI001CCBFE7C|nr:hypothetical protein [Haloprofundus salinisoli]
MGDSVTVEVVVDAGVKADWKHHAEQNAQYDHLSDLVRTAVSKQIARDKSEDARDVPDGIKNMFYDIESQYERLESLMMSANHSLESLENQHVTQDDIEDTIAFHTSKIQSVLEEMDDSNETGESESDE